MIKQRTPRETVQTAGIGLHSGEKVTLTLHPAPVNTGIIFRRVDLSPAVEIKATYDNVTDTMLCTSLGPVGAKIATVEHVMSALAGLGIDNAIIDVDGPEIPIMDGSAAPFVELIQSAGIIEQKAPRQFIRILKPIRVEENDKYAQFTPYNGCQISFKIAFNHPVFIDKPQTVDIHLTPSQYIEDISQARTFGFLSDYEKLRENNLAKGGSLDNAIVVDDHRILNEGGLRFDSEFVMHKVLDAIGDIYLLGCHVIGAFEGYRSGHGLNNRLLKQLIMQPDAWEYTHLEESLPCFKPSSQALENHAF